MSHESGAPHTAVKDWMGCRYGRLRNRRKTGAGGCARMHAGGIGTGGSSAASRQRCAGIWSFENP